MGNVGSLEPEDKLPGQKKIVKKVYCKPMFRFERVFETQALSCGKIHGHGTICNINRKTS
jgi:hypothetical protein